MLELPNGLRDDRRDPVATTAAMADAFAKRPGTEWASEFAARDVCCSIVLSVEEVLAHPHFASRGTFDRKVSSPDGASIPALPVPVVPGLRRADPVLRYPALGEAAALLQVEPAIGPAAF
jgi:crotonobetainyl-CoA:carnitine CoA-transferase CaiB-like acyl-CoA transferase